MNDKRKTAGVTWWRRVATCAATGLADFGMVTLVPLSEPPLRKDTENKDQWHWTQLQRAVWITDSKYCTDSGICITGLFQQQISYYVVSLPNSFFSQATYILLRQKWLSVHSSQLSHAFYVHFASFWSLHYYKFYCQFKLNYFYSVYLSFCLLI